MNDLGKTESWTIKVDYCCEKIWVSVPLLYEAHKAVRQRNSRWLLGQSKANQRAAPPVLKLQSRFGKCHTNDHRLHAHKYPRMGRLEMRSKTKKEMLIRMFQQLPVFRQPYALWPLEPIPLQPRHCHQFSSLWAARECTPFQNQVERMTDEGKTLGIWVRLKCLETPLHNNILKSRGSKLPVRQRQSFLFAIPVVSKSK